MILQNPPYMASRQLMIPRIAAAGTLSSPLPCQAWYGYMVTSAHCVEVEVGADGPPSAPLSGAAAITPPAGAKLYPRDCKGISRTNLNGVSKGYTEVPSPGSEPAPPCPESYAVTNRA
jgi:hypothetical protein